MTERPALPACCTPLDAAWPFRHAVPGARLVSTRFDPARLDPEDFTRWGVPPMAGVNKRQAEYLAGRLCAWEALRVITGAGAIPAIGEDRAPCWPQGTVGSITHGAGWAAAITARHTQWRGLGLDVEKTLPVARADRLAGEILTARELQGYAEQDETSRALRVTLTFSIKESLFKALYPLVNKRFYFHDAELIHHDDTGWARLRLLTTLTPDWRAGSELDGQFVQFDDYLLSLVHIPAE